MADAPSHPSPLDLAADEVGSTATKAFSTLGNETRLAILVSLWEAYEPFADNNAVPFEELRERMEVEDTDRLHYHLVKLEGDFIERTDPGYELTNTGQQLIRTVLGGVGIEPPTFEATQIDYPCPLCDAKIMVTYQEKHFTLYCTECEGYYDMPDQPDGMLSRHFFQPSGLSGRGAEAVHNVLAIDTQSRLGYLFHDVCDECLGRVEGSLHVCEDHADEGVCDACGRREPFIARYECQVCKNHEQGPPRAVARQHPTYDAFLLDHEIYPPDGRYNLSFWKRDPEIYSSAEQTLIATGPAEVQVTFEHDGDELSLTIDEELRVIDVDW